MNPKLGAFFVAIFAMAFFGAISPLIFTDTAPGKVGQLPVVGPAPDFELTKSNGELLRSSELEDKVWVFNFFFTSCDGPCPQLATHLGLLQTEFEAQTAVHLLSLTVDPDTDSIEVLTRYAEQVGANSERWHLLRTEKEQIKKLAVEGFRVFAESGQGEHGSMIHSEHLVLVDRRGIIRGYYRGTERAEIEKLKTDIRKLL